MGNVDTRQGNRVAYDDGQRPGQLAYGSEDAILLRDADLVLQGGECRDIGGLGVPFPGGLSIVTAGPLPPPSVDLRGQLWILRGGIGVADEAWVVIKDDTDSYVWEQIALGGGGGLTETSIDWSSGNLVLPAPTTTITWVRILASFTGILTLPNAATAPEGTRVIVIDAGGGLGIFPTSFGVTINTAGGNINGRPSQAMFKPWEVMELVVTNGNWTIARPYPVPSYGLLRLISPQVQGFISSTPGPLTFQSTTWAQNSGVASDGNTYLAPSPSDGGTYMVRFSTTLWKTSGTVPIDVSFEIYVETSPGSGTYAGTGHLTKIHLPAFNDPQAAAIADAPVRISFNQKVRIYVFTNLVGNETFWFDGSVFSMERVSG